jgi:tetratricopeptide (TPR) repeat protein/serine/threonine protein kinase
MTLPTASQWARYSALRARLAPLPAPGREAALQALRTNGNEDPQVLSLVALHWALPPNPTRDRCGDRLGNFTLEERLGVGGMGVVYRAQQHLGPVTRPVAVKLIHPALLLSAREEAMARFLAELQTLVMLQHEHIARIYDGGIYADPRTHEQLPYLAMELVRDGLPITSYVRDYALSWQERLALFLRVCHAVRYAHEHRVVHRDLKPANILVDPDGRPVVIDFGLAQACDAVLPGAHLAASGTPAYMSPEQMSDAFGAVSAKSDVYALGLILYELLAEQHPYVLPRGGSVEQWCQVMLEATPPPLRQSNAAYGEELEAIVAAALAKQPADRIPVAVLRSRLERYLQSTVPETSRPTALHDLDQAGTGSPPAPAQPSPPIALPPAPDTASGPGATRQNSPEAERRQLTVMFCDLEGSTALSGQLDPEELREVLRAYLETCAAVVARFAGNIEKFLGDGVLVYFGYPQAHEDDPQRAVRAGLGIVEAMARLNTRLAQTQDVQLTVRVGIHTGLVVAGELRAGDTQEPQAIVGETPNIAARLQGLAGTNTVVCSAATARLVEGYFIQEALGPQVLKGVATPVPVYRIVGESAARTRLDIAATRGLTPFVGREPEVALLLERWAAAKEGRGQVVLLSGEAGIGKSRLVQAFTAQLTGEAYTHIVYHCSPYYQQSAFYPVIDQLQRRLQWRTDDPLVERLRKLEEALGSYGFALEEVVPLLAPLLGLPLPERYPPLPLTPERQKQKTLTTLLAWVLKEAERQSVCVVMEDLHWGDPSTIEWLSMLVDQLPTARMLLLLLFRPESQPPWAGRSYISPLALSRLSNHQTEGMIGHVTGGKRLPAEVVQHLVATTDGVPLFVEELTKMVLESGLVTEREGRYELTGPRPSLAIPPTLHDSLMARLDRLGAVKQVAQLGAMLGREFSYALLQAVVALEETTLQHGLSQLVAAELLYQRGLPPQAQYLFKHALIQEAAYHSMLRSTRRHHHRRIAQVLEAQFPEICESHPELVAHHALQGGIWEQAVAYFRQAGEKALARSANREAVACFEQTLAIARQGQERAEEGRALTNLGIAYHRLGQYERAITCYEQALAIYREVQDQAEEGRALINLGNAYGYGALSQYEQAIACYEQALAIYREVQDRAEEGRTLTNLGHTYRALSQSERAITFHEQALAIYREVQDRAGEAMVLDNLGVAYRTLGQSERASALHEQALAIYREVQDRAEEGRTLTNLGNAYHMLGQYERAITCHEQALAIYREVQDRAGEGWALNNMGNAYSALSQYERAIACHEQALTIRREVKNRLGEGTVLKNLGADYSALSQYERAIACYKQALTIYREGQERAGEGRVLDNLGVAYGALSQYERAIACHEQALATHREVKNRFSEGTALTNLGNAYQGLSQYERAIACHEQALAIYREVKNRHREGVALDNLGVAYCALGQSERAIPFYEQALTIFREVGAREGEGGTCGRLMAVWKAQHHPRLAIFYGKQAVNVFQEIRGSLQSLARELQEGFLTTRAPVYRELAEVLITEGRLLEAQQVLDLLKAEEHLNFVRPAAAAATALSGQVTLTPEEAVWAQRYTAIADRVAALGAEWGTLRALPARTAAEDARYMDITTL